MAVRPQAAVVDLYRLKKTGHSLGAPLNDEGERSVDWRAINLSSCVPGVAGWLAAGAVRWMATSIMSAKCCIERSTAVALNVGGWECGVCLCSWACRRFTSVSSERSCGSTGHAMPVVDAHDVQWLVGQM